ncbi:MAG TPA: LTA synthase family protein [Gammaproteobacteria bacterium]
MRIPLRDRRFRHLIPLVSTLLLMGVYDLVVRRYFGYTLTWSGLAADALAELALGYWLYWLMRPLWAFLLLQTVLMGTLYIGNGLKIDLLAAPILPSDANTLPVLLDVLFGWRFVLAVSPLVAMALVFLLGIRRDRYAAIALAVGVVPLWLALLFLPGPLTKSLDGFFGYKPFIEVNNFQARGPLVYFLNEYARQRMLQGELPTRAEVAAALKDRGFDKPLPLLKVEKPRDVYVILMEAFWDPMLLSSVHFSQDPMAPELRALWDEAGHGWAQVPVFGGGTANSEFEELCGAPVTPGGIAFVTSVVHAMPCLPMLLAQAGYRTVAVAPDEYGTWNRNNVYRYLGFSRFYAKESFFLDDLNGGFLADASLFSQMLERVPKEPAPRFVYTVTTSGHYPFQMDPATRPPVVKASSPNHAVTDYANAVYYNSRDLADYLAKLRAADPDALIVVFGDHLPALGNKLRDFTASRLFPHNVERFTPMQMRARQSTPLIVIDGRRGPLKLGRLSLFEIPHLVLSLLGASGPAAVDVFTPPAHTHPRPIGEGRFLVTDDAGEARFCDSDAPKQGCEQADAWYRAMQTLRTDMVSGDEYLVPLLYGDAYQLAIPDTGESYHAPMDVHPCGITITAWGPREGRVGRIFNPHRGGSSTFWIEYTGEAGRVQAWLGSHRLEVINRDHRIAATLSGRARLYLPGSRALTLKCNGDDKPVQVGDFHVRLF